MLRKPTIMWKGCALRMAPTCKWRSNRGMSSGDLCCCSLPQCEALRTCRSGSLTVTQSWCGCEGDAACNLHNEMSNLMFTNNCISQNWICGRSGALWKGGGVAVAARQVRHWMRGAPGRNSTRGAPVTHRGGNEREDVQGRQGEF